MKNKISVILPTYNEAENIRSIREIISKELEKKNYEIIVVDDNSPDGTSELVAKLKNIYPNLESLNAIRFWQGCGSDEPIRGDNILTR